MCVRASGRECQGTIHPSFSSLPRDTYLLGILHLFVVSLLVVSLLTLLHGKLSISLESSDPSGHGRMMVAAAA